MVRKAKPRITVKPKDPAPVVVTEREKELIARLSQAQRELAIRRELWTAGKRVVAVMPWCEKDWVLAVRSLVHQAWLGRSDGELVLVQPKATPAEQIGVVLAAAHQAWAQVTIAAAPFDLPDEHWPQGPNWSFMTACRHCYERELDFLILEPDAVPLKVGWFERLVRAYRGCGRPYMGTVEEAASDGRHPRHMPGNAVYSWRAWLRAPIRALYVPWDVQMAHDGIMDHVAKTDLVQQIWGAMNKPPTFQVPESLGILSPTAVLFHRCKDGSLMERLRERGREACMS